MVTVKQLSFANGELDPKLYARVDLVRYATGLRKARNFIIAKFGGAMNRSGTEFIGEVFVPAKKSRLVPFMTNSGQQYVVEASDAKLRFVKNGALITEAPKNFTSPPTQANPCVVTITSHGYANGDVVYISGVGGMTQLNGRDFKVANKTTNTFELQHMDGTNVDSTGFGAYTSGGSAARHVALATALGETAHQEMDYSQSAGVLVMTHTSEEPRTLTRTSDTSWSIAQLTLGPSIAAPTGVGCSPTGSSQNYVVTAVHETTFEESLASAPAGSNATYPVTISWNAVSGALEYHVYKERSGVYGFIGTARGTSFVESAAITPDFEDTPPDQRDIYTLFGRPGACSFYQQRLVLANFKTVGGVEAPDLVISSRARLHKNFTVSNPQQANDSVTFQLFGSGLNVVRRLIGHRRLLILTSDGEWVAMGDGAGILKPDAINLQQHGYNGSGSLRPIVSGSSILHVAEQGPKVWDIGFSFQTDGYEGRDLSLFASHLAEGYTFVDWAYQKAPNSTLWIVRSDGVLLGLTYVREHDIVAWHQHDLDGGSVENVCAIREGTEDVLYLTVKRTINGATKRYIERMSTRRVADIVDAIFMDSTLSYDGRNGNASHTMTLSGGTTWDHTETLTLTSSTGYFAAGDVGSEIHLKGADGTLIRFEITGFTGATVVTGKVHKTVPVGMRSVAISSWSKAVKTVTGLWHLEGKKVSCFADGFVVANPNRATYPVLTVTNGSVTLERPYAVIHVGLPITSDLVTLDVDTPQGETLSDKRMLVSRVTLQVETTRGLFAGRELPADSSQSGLQEFQLRENESYESPPSLQTGRIHVNIESAWNDNGRVAIRQTDPVPCSVLGISISGLVPFRG